LKSLELAVGGMPTSVWTRLAYAGDNQPLPPESDAQKVFARVFTDQASGGAGDDQALTILKAQRKSVLDAVADDYAELSRQLGTEDKQRIDQHFNSIREIETRMDAATPSAANCTPPDQPPTFASLDGMGDAGYPLLGKLMMDLMVTALACDRTRVI